MTKTGPQFEAAAPLDLAHYVPHYLITIANRWTATSSRTYLRRFGIGIVEWRVLASLGARKVASSLDIVQLIGTDAASVSKAVRSLEARGSIVPIQGKFVGRTKPYALTPAGQELFAQICDLALERERMLLAPLSGDERAQLIALLSKLYMQLPRLQELGANSPE